MQKRHHWNGRTRARGVQFVRKIRPLPEIVRSRSVDQDRLQALLQQARETGAGCPELDVLLSEEHAFDRMCRRSAPLDAVALGMSWGETIVHGGDPRDTAVIRERGMVEIDGELVGLTEATRRVAARGRRAALGAWAGPSGNIDGLAQLTHPRAERHPESSKAQTSADEAATDPDEGITERPTPTPGQNYELF